MEPERPTSPRAILAASCLTGFIGPFLMSAVNVGLPLIQAEFQAGAYYLGWVTMAYMLTYGALMVPMAKLGDIFGMERLFTWGTAVTCAGLAWGGLAGSLAGLLAARLLAGIGASMVTVAGMPMLISAFDAAKRGRMLGLYTGAVYVGLTSGPFLGGVLVQGWGWRAIFWAGLVPSALCLALAVLLIRAPARDGRDHSFDLPGAVLFSASLSLGIFGGSSLPEASGWLCLGAAAAGLTWFVLQELRAPEPVFDVRIFNANRSFTYAAAAHFINYAASISLLFLLSLYLQIGKGMAPGAAGLVLAIQPAVQVVAAPLAGRLSDRVPPRIPASAGMALITLGLGCLALADAATPLAFIIACQLAIGLGYGLFTTPNTNAMMGAVEPPQYGAASATVGTMRVSGAVVSMAVATLLVSLFMGRAEINAQTFPAFMKAMKTGLTLSCAMCALGVYFSLARHGGASPGR